MKRLECRQYIRAFQGGGLHVWFCSAALALSAEVALADLLYGVNHTHWAINHFSVDGKSAIDIVGPYQRGGGGGGYFAPSQWKPELDVLVEWETGVAYPDGFPGYADEVKYEAWANKLRIQKRQHSKRVVIPDYTNQDVCGLTIHFLPCDELLATTSCYAYGSPEYPIKVPLELPVPESCPARTR